MSRKHTDILNFWFEEIPQKSWWIKDDALDQAIKERFAELHYRAANGELYRWREQPLGRLAEIIILDQFSRNLYRGQPESFASDSMALVLAQEAIDLGIDKQFSVEQKIFVYLPYMHSESLLIHEQAVKLFDQPGLEDNLNFEWKHKVIIERFGRYPHRNEVLGRESTPEELEFLKEPGSSF
jgi:uncharacterized protein (DUF924 family)